MKPFCPTGIGPPVGACVRRPAGCPVHQTDCPKSAAVSTATPPCRMSKKEGPTRAERAQTAAATMPASSPEKRAAEGA